MFTDDEFFGSPEGIALSRRSASLWALLRDNPRYAYYGRLVSLSDPERDTADILSAVAKLQGTAVSYFYPADAAEGLFAQLGKEVSVPIGGNISGVAKLLWKRATGLKKTLRSR